MKIYILYDYEEHGAENLVCTHNKNAVPAMLLDNWGPRWKIENLTEELNKLDEFLKENVVGDWGLSKGWGGIRLHIVEPKEYN